MMQRRAFAGRAGGAGAGAIAGAALLAGPDRTTFARCGARASTSSEAIELRSLDESSAIVNEKKS